MDFEKAKDAIYNTQLDPKIAPAVGAVLDEVEELQKAYALASRILDDHLDCPFSFFPVNWPECGEKICGSRGPLCWQRFLREKAESEQVCRVCGCTQDNACLGGCCWVEEDLCSKCAERTGQTVGLPDMEKQF